MLVQPLQMFICHYSNKTFPCSLQRKSLLYCFKLLRNRGSKAQYQQCFYHRGAPTNFSYKLTRAGKMSTPERELDLPLLQFIGTLTAHMTWTSQVKPGASWKNDIYGTTAFLKTDTILLDFDYLPVPSSEGPYVLKCFQWNPKVININPVVYGTGKCWEELLTQGDMHTPVCMYQQPLGNWFDSAQLRTKHKQSENPEALSYLFIEPLSPMD